MWGDRKQEEAATILQMGDKDGQDSGRDSKGRIWEFFFFLRFTYFWLHWVLIAAYRLPLVVESTGSRHAGSVVAVLGLQSLGSVAVEHRLGWLKACGILVPPPRSQPVSPALAGGSLTT